MKAARYNRFGSARDVLEVGEIDTPSARPGEVLVRLKTSGVNPSDVKKRAGSFPDLLDDGPVIPNSDGAGIVEAVGDGVPESRVGERVWVYQAQFARRSTRRHIPVDTPRFQVRQVPLVAVPGVCQHRLRLLADRLRHRVEQHRQPALVTRVRRHLRRHHQLVVTVHRHLRVVAGERVAARASSRRRRACCKAVWIWTTTRLYG